MKRFFLLIPALLLASIVFLLLLGFTKQVNLPDNVDAIIEEAIRLEVPNLYLGESGYAKSGEINIWYESIGDTANTTVVLISGAAATAFMWPQNFITDLVEAGFHVVRFDNREIGFSSKVSDWTERNAFLVKDQANDVIAILDHIGKRKVHVAGISMGGMIAQELVINHPDRVLSMTLLNSSAHVFDLKLSRYRQLPTLVALARKVSHSDNPDLGQRIKSRIELIALLKADNTMSDQEIRRIAGSMLFNQKEGRDRSPDAVRHQIVAIQKSGSRYDMLRNVKQPTYIIHGNKDPLILPEHAEKYAPLFKNSKLEWIEDMGHVPTLEQFELVNQKLISFISEL